MCIRDRCGHAGNETQECPAEIKFSLKPVASGVHGIMADMFWQNQPSGSVQHRLQSVQKMHRDTVLTISTWTNVSKAWGIKNAAHFESDAILQDMIVWLRRCETLWWDRCRNLHRGYRLTRLMRLWCCQYAKAWFGPVSTTGMITLFLTFSMQIKDLLNMQLTTDQEDNTTGGKLLTNLLILLCSEIGRPYVEHSQIQRNHTLYPLKT